jgi:hypothetical protein
MSMSKFAPLLSLAALFLAPPSQAQSLQVTTMRFQDGNADITGNGSTGCERSSLAIYAFDNVRRYGPGGTTQAQRSVTVLYGTQNWCEGTSLEVKAQVLAPDAYLPSTLDTARVTLSASVPARRCKFSDTPHCEFVMVPLALEAVWTGDPQLYANSRQSSVSRIATQLIKSRTRDRIVAADVEFSLQIDGLAATTDNISANLRHTSTGEITIEELPRDPEGS